MTAAATNTTMYGTTSEEFVDGNAELFERRRAILEQLAELELAATEMAGETAGETTGETAAAATAAAAPVTQRRAITRLRRQLDDVTAEIVRFNLGLVRSYCKRFTSNANREDSADFEAAGMLGLMRAIESFDPSQGRFGHWAFKPIQREVLRSVRNADHPNVNLGDFERRPEILRAFRHLQGEDDRYTPSHQEVATLVGVTVDQVRRVLAAPRMESVHRPLGEAGEGSLGDTIESTAPGPEAVVVSSMTLSALKTYGFSALDPRELYVIVRRFGLDGEPEDKLADIGDTLGLSREAVRQIEAKAIAKIQHPMVLRKIQRHGRQ